MADPADAVQTQLAKLRTKYGLNKREDDDRLGTESPQRAAEQQMLDWKEGVRGAAPCPSPLAPRTF